VANYVPYGDPGLFDEFVQDLDVAAFETPLLRVGKIVRWEIFEPIVKAAVSRAPKGPGGRRRFHPLLMFKVLVLQRLHGLADDATGFQITDRKSFRAFLGLTPGDALEFHWNREIEQNAIKRHFLNQLQCVLNALGLLRLMAHRINAFLEFGSNCILIVNNQYSAHGWELWLAFRGRRNVTRVPSPSLLWMVKLPPCAST